MFCDLELFESLSPASGDVILGDRVTRLKIQGIGTVKCKIGDLFLHIKCPGHGLHSSFDTGLDIVFPEFSTKAIIGLNDIYLDAVPLDDFMCLNITSLCPKLATSDTTKEPTVTERDNILKLLHDYYKHVKMKRATNVVYPSIGGHTMYDLSLIKLI